MDPTDAELAAAAPAELSPSKRREISGDEARAHPLRPRLEVMDHHVEGVLLAATSYENELVIQEIHLAVTADELLLVALTPHTGPPFNLDDLRHMADAATATSGQGLFHLFDEIAEDYLDLVDEFNEEIDELEDQVEDMGAADVRERLSRLRHDVLHVRRVLAPTRDAARQVLDGRLDLQGAELFPREVESQFADAYDKLLRAMDGLDLSRDLIAGVRDYHQAQIATSQNEVMKRLTIITSLLLAPTFIVGMYGQNFRQFPEVDWHYGYAFSWALILLSTIGQLAWFRWKRWL